MNVEGSPSARFAERFAAALWPISENAAAPADDRFAQEPAFAVYRNTVMKGCVDALEANYPAVARLVGSAWFRAAAAVFVSAQPPRAGSLVAYGAGFADFLRGFEPAAELPYLPDVARLDRDWTESHVAADAVPLTAAAVAVLAPEQLGALQLRLHPATRHAWFADQPIYSIWSANRPSKQAAEAAAEPIWRGEGALLTRPQSAVIWSALPQAGAALLDACAARLPLGTAAERVLSACPDADLQTVFAQLLNAGAFVDSRNAQPTTD